MEIATGEVTEYTWDHRNRLTSVVTKDSGGATTHQVDYTYDVYDRRITKTIDADGDGAGTATEEHFVYDGEHISLVFDETGTQTHRYLHGPQIDQVLAEETAAGETHWALSDHQGSVRDVIDNSGTVLNHVVYDSFGQVTSESDPTFDFRFGYTGRELDEETGMMYYRARYFDPAVGTFVGEDPLGFGAGDANLYRYVFNSPTNYTDPSGMRNAPVRPPVRQAPPPSYGSGASGGSGSSSGTYSPAIYADLPVRPRGYNPYEPQPFRFPSLEESGPQPRNHGEITDNLRRQLAEQIDLPNNQTTPASEPAMCLAPWNRSDNDDDDGTVSLWRAPRNGRSQTELVEGHCSVKG
jgi:RHS repeat-associated protein